jgi:hypothetical protein
MNILFLFTDGDHFDYIADYTMYGLRRLGHAVLDIPRRRAHYEPLDSINIIHRQIVVGSDPVDRSVAYRLEDFDLIIAENPCLFMTGPSKEMLAQMMHLPAPRIALLGNDPINQGPLPNVRLDYRCRMAIREKCLQTSTVALPYVDDFPLHFVIPSEYCRYVPPSERSEGAMFSMSLNTRRRSEYAKHFTNQQYEDCREYFDAIRRHRYGISIWGGGVLCQRDSELAGNTLLCRARFAKYTRDYDSFDHIDDVDSIEFSDIDDLKNRMAYYDAHPDDYERLLKACYEKTMKYFTAEAQAQRLIEWAVSGKY